MLDGLKSFHKDVSYLVSHWNIIEFNTSFINTFSNVMLPNMDVFCVHCNNQLPWRQESPQGLADLGSAIGLAPQSLGLLGGLKGGTGVS